MPGQVSLKEIEDMLEDCAPGAVIVAKVHHNWVIWNGRTYRAYLAASTEHAGTRIQAGHVKRMARFFDILPCAQSWIPALA